MSENLFAMTDQKCFHFLAKRSLELIAFQLAASEHSKYLEPESILMLQPEYGLTEA